jgi:DNA ligase 4
MYEVIRKRSSVTEGTLTVDELNEVLDGLSKHTGNSSVQHIETPCLHG